MKLAEDSRKKVVQENAHKKIFIGGLDASISTAELKGYFEQIGPVMEACVLKDAITEISRGFGFVTFENAEDSERVVSLLHT